MRPRAALVPLLLLMGTACREPEAKLRETQRRVGLPWDFFPVGSESKRRRLWAMVGTALDGKRAALPSPAPGWMQGSWSIEGSKAYATFSPTPAGLILEGRQPAEAPRDPAPFRTEVVVPGDAQVLRPDASVIKIDNDYAIQVDSRTGLMVILGPSGLNRGSGLLAGQVSRVRTHRDEQGAVVVDEWTFISRRAVFGFGVILGEAETWTLVRQGDRRPKPQWRF